MSLLDGVQNVIKGNAGRINTVSSVYAIANTVIKLAGGKGISSSGYRPSQWGHTRNSSSLVNVSCNFGGFFADAVLNFSGDVSATITNHPVQTGANISDHAFINPIRINVELGISDAMAFYTAEKYTVQTLADSLQDAVKINLSNYDADAKIGAMLTGESTKSTKALALLMLIARAREPFSIYGVDGINYDNMLIEDISWSKDASSKYSVRVQLECVEIMLMDVAKQKVSARQWTTSKSTKNGEVQGVDQGSWLYKAGF